MWDMIATSYPENRASAQMRMTPSEKPSSEIVCLVDDDPTVLRSTGRLLVSDGFAVRPFNKGEDFIADRKSTRLNSSHGSISYAVFCLKKKNHRVGKELLLLPLRALERLLELVRLDRDAESLAAAAPGGLDRHRVADRLVHDAGGVLDC